MLHLPAKLVGKDKIPKVRGDIVQAIGEKKVAAVQALSPTKYRVGFRSSSYRHEKDINGISFRGVTLTPHPAYEEVKSVFVDRAPLQMPDQYLYEILAPYSRVLSVEHLKVKGFQTVKSGTQRVSMVVTQSIPAVIRISNIPISNIPISFRYRGQPPFCFECQEVGHARKDCPKSRKTSKITLNADLRPEDLPNKLNNVKEGDLRVKLNNSKKVGQVPEGSPVATSSSLPPSLITADQSDIPSQRTTNNPHTINAPNSDQPIHTIDKSPSLSDTISTLKVFNIPAEMDRKATSAAVSRSAAVKSIASIRKPASSSCSVQSSQALRTAVGTLKVFQHPSETDSTAKPVAGPSFNSLARETQSAAAHSTTSICDKDASVTGFLLKLKGQVVTATVPWAQSFAFSLKPACSFSYSSVPRTSTWSASSQQDLRTQPLGSKGRTLRSLTKIMIFPC